MSSPEIRREVEIPADLEVSVSGLTEVLKEARQFNAEANDLVPGVHSDMDLMMTAQDRQKIQALRKRSSGIIRILDKVTPLPDGSWRDML